jgi:NAD(P)-dependent dehydrogenase (short-subunit alcohol dehydrogenase family)
MGMLDGRVALITGAGRGLGREHALLFAKEGAKVVVNDLGGDTHGEGADKTPAQEVVDEIKAAGGEAVANYGSCSNFEDAKRMIDEAVETFGDLHVLINNAGILRDRVVFNMTEAEWDAVVNVHMKGHYCPTHHATAYWRAQSKAGKEVNASIVNTSSGAGLMGNAGQFNYAAAKAGIAAMTIVAAKEVGRYGVKVNCIAPVARTRLTLETPGLDQVVKPPDDPNKFDVFHPGNISPLVAYLSTAENPFNGGVFHVFAGQVGLFTGWSLGETIETKGRWEVADLANQIKTLADKVQGKLASEGFSDGQMNAMMMQAVQASQ